MSENETPAIVVDENTIGIWFLPMFQSDWMAHLGTTPKGIKLTYRFRYYDPDDPKNDPHSGKDRKSWYSGVLNITKEEAIESMRRVSKGMWAGAAFGQPVSEVLMTDAGVEDFVKRFSAQSWTHMNFVPTT